MHAIACLSKPFCLHVQGICNFVDVGGEPIHEAEGVGRALQALEGNEQSRRQGIQLFETDHVLAPEGMTIATLLEHQKAGRTAVAVLSGAPGTPGFKELHDALLQGASAGTRRHLASCPAGRLTLMLLKHSRRTSLGCTARPAPQCMCNVIMPTSDAC